jgi:S-adenosylmethionine-dependent methyltransferase
VAVDIRRDGARSSLLWDVLAEVVAARTAATGRSVLDIIDVGGGTGGLAVPFAALGHNVTVVDPSPDALAAAKRRAAEVSTQLSVVQGEAASVDSLIGLSVADLVICHNVLEYVDSPADAMAAIGRVLRPAATVSVLASNAVAAVLHRALAGRFAEAWHMLADADPASDPDRPRRFTLPELTRLVEAAGLRAGEAHGLRIFSGLVPGALVDGDAAAAEDLRGLEGAAATYPPLRDIASRLHLLAHR